jgi:hypothetical protein
LAPRKLARCSRLPPPRLTIVFANLPIASEAVAAGDENREANVAEQERL